MAGLPELQDIFVVIVLLVPGFMALILAKKIAVVDTKFSDFENTAISIFLSIVILIPFSSLSKIQDYTTVKDKLITDPNSLLILSIITLVTGLALGALFKLIFRRAISGDVLWNNLLKILRKSNNRRVDIITDGNETFRGYLTYASESTDNNDKIRIVVESPKKIIIDPFTLNPKEEEIDDKDTNLSIMFNEDNIKRIIFHTSLAQDDKTISFTSSLKKGFVRRERKDRN